MARTATVRIDTYQTTGSSPGPCDTRIVLPPVELEHGGRLEGGRLAVRVAGPAAAPAVVVLGGISAGREVVDLSGGPGWWGLAGPERAIDPAAYRVIGVDWIAGRGDSTRAEDLPEGVATRLTPRDQATAIVAALDVLGIDRLHACVGASYGGMTALALAAACPRRVGRLVVLGAAHEPHPMATALRSLQREIVELGLANGAGRASLILARGLAMTTYRSAREFATRFDSTPDAASRFPVETYLRERGERFAEAFTPGAFLVLSRSIDLQRVDPHAVRVPTTLIAFEPDAVAPAWQVRALSQQLGGRWTLKVLRSVYGHDAFLKETAALAPIVADALCRPEVTR